MDASTQPATVNLEPTANQYEAIARAFIDSTAHDVTQATGPDGDRRAPALRVLAQLLGLVGYLATLPDGPARVARLKAYAGQA